jgi:two-component system sensor histidine kinase/response regulator
MRLDRSQYAVLFVDDEPHNLVTFRYAMDDQFNVLTAGGAEEALKILESNENVVVLVADQRMPKTSGVELCARAKVSRPDVVRMIATAYADIHEAIDAINHGHVVRYIVKPWRNEELAVVLETAIDFAHMQRTMQDMELRLLRAGQARVAVAVHDEVLHEITNPLTIVKCSIDRTLEILDKVLEEGLSPEALRARALLLEAREEQQSASSAVDHVSAVARRLQKRDETQPGGEDGACEAARAVDSTVRIVRRQVERIAGLELTLEDEPLVQVEASAVGQIVLNLVLNAAQAIETAKLNGRTIRVTLSSDDEDAVLVVADDGPGIAGELLPRIFDAYMTTRPGGSGVGLALVRDIAMRAGGTVRARSSEGEGSRFEVRLPRVRESIIDA